MCTLVISRLDESIINRFKKVKYIKTLIINDNDLVNYTGDCKIHITEGNTIDDPRIYCVEDYNMVKYYSNITKVVLNNDTILHYVPESNIKEIEVYTQKHNIKVFVNLFSMHYKKVYLNLRQIGDMTDILHLIDADEISIDCSKFTIEYLEILLNKGIKVLTIFSATEIFYPKEYKQLLEDNHTILIFTHYSNVFRNHSNDKYLEKYSLPEDIRYRNLELYQNPIQVKSARKV